MTTYHFSSSHISAQFTLTGWNCGLGVLRLGDVVVPAFGPHSLPLSDVQQFGIALTSAVDPEVVNSEEKSVLKGWTRCYGERNAWLYFASSVTPNSIELSAKLIGNEQLRMAFYVQAKQCSLGDGTSFFPGELRSYQGIQSLISFDQTAHFRCKEKCTMQLIPLAGNGCFWNANFLLAFEFSRARSLFDVINLVLD